MFKSKEVDDQGQVVVPAPMDHLDSLREHRFFCPWKNSQAQKRPTASSDTPDLTAWKALATMIKNESDLRGVYDGRSKRAGRVFIADAAVSSPAGADASSPAPGTPQVAVSKYVEEDAEADEKARETKDKERWARLRKVKSLFDTKGSRKLRRPLSRPGTAHSEKSVTGTKE